PRGNAPHGRRALSDLREIVSCDPHDLPAESRVIIRRHARDAACAVAIVLMVAHNHFNVRAVRDIGPDDEGWYLGSGVLLGKPGYPNGADGWPIPEQGPMYSLWYF